MENIHILDNFLEKEELEIVVQKIKTKRWEFGHTSVENTSPFWSFNLMDDDFFTFNIKRVIEKTFSKNLMLDRVYSNGQTYGQDGRFHTDSEKPNTMTACLYINNLLPEEMINAGGHYVVKIPEQKYYLSVEPINNRLVFFPSGYLHRGMSFNRHIDELRVCIAWKFTVVE